MENKTNLNLTVGQLITKLQSLNMPDATLASFAHDIYPLPIFAITIKTANTKDGKVVLLNWQLRPAEDKILDNFE
jgi:hypothetical protein